ncbi:hypothetical protein GCM10017784_27750 [Deinococcus indicus]|nr:hypothetical protein GCM10017784_27750 [Deinococcus indicus]
MLDDYDPDIRDLVMHVLTLEQEHISMKSPRIKVQLEELIDTAAKRQVGGAGDAGR